MYDHNKPSYRHSKIQLMLNLAFLDSLNIMVLTAESYHYTAVVQPFCNSPQFFFSQTQLNLRSNFGKILFHFSNVKDK